jgi:integrase
MPGRGRAQGQDSPQSHGQSRQAPQAAEGDHGMVLEPDQLGALVQGFKGSPLFPIVAVAAFTGMRRNEILGLQWGDLDMVNKTLQIVRSVDKTDKYGLRFKGPKNERSKRGIAIGDGLLALLLTERERHLRIVAGVPDGVAVDLSLVKLPNDALMFPSPPSAGENFSFTALRNPNAFSKAFERAVARLGFAGLRFHDLRGSYATLLLDQGQPVHAVAARLGHSAAVLLKAYAKRTKSADAAAAAVTDNLAKGVFGN